MVDPHTISLPLFDYLEEGVLLLDEQRNVLRVNKAAQRFLGGKLEAGLDLTELMKAIGSGSEALQDLGIGHTTVIVSSGRLVEIRSKKCLDSAVQPECHTKNDIGHEVWLARDCSEELRLHAQVAEQGHILASSNEAYLVVDTYGNIRYANPFCEEERGYTLGMMSGMRLNECEALRGDQIDESQSDGQVLTDKELQLRLAEYIEAGGVHHYNAWHSKKNGSRMPVEVGIRPYRLRNEMVLLITPRDEGERLRHLQELMDARAVAEASDQAKSAFMAVTSHELRTPLTAIIAFCELLQLDHGEENEEIARYLKLIHRSSKSLLALINDILDFAKIEGRTLKMEMQPLKIAGIMNDLHDRWHLRYQQKDVAFECRIDCGELRPLLGDPLRINQVLDNLVGNALKFTEQGQVIIELQDDEKFLSFVIKDSGPGIPLGSEEKIFDAFFQLENATTRKSDGTGLGLYICKRIALLLGGDVQLVDSLEEGSVFIFRLPWKGPLG